MRPTHTILNSANVPLLNTVFSGDELLHPRVFPDRINLRGGELCGPRPLTAIISSVADFIRDIRLMCVPSKVCEGVVVAVAVIMTALFSVWPRPYKGSQNKRVYLKILWDIAFPKHNRAVLCAWAQVCEADKAGSRISNAASVGNLVVSLVSNYRQPLFHTELYGIKPTLAQA